MLHTKEEGLYPGYFDKYDVIHVAGDHGGHFSNSGLMIEESKFYRQFQKEIRICFFPAYHAHGRADAAGAEDKRSAIRDRKKKKWRFGAAGYTAMTNESNDARSVAFDMRKINRSVTAYTTKDARVSSGGSVGDVKKWNQVSYEYKNRSEKTEGVVKYRIVSGDSSPWIFTDLLRRGAGVFPLCQICCQTEDAVVRHTKKVCPVVQLNPSAGMDCNAMWPPENRDSGTKHPRAKGVKIKKSTGEAKLKYYCNVPNCPHKAAGKCFMFSRTHDNHISKMHAQEDDWESYIKGCFCLVPGTCTSHGKIMSTHSTPHIIPTSHTHCTYIAVYGS